MERIQTAEIRARKERNKKWIVGIVLIGLMVISTAGYSLMSGTEEDSSSKVDEAGLTFYKQGGLWRVVIDGEVFGFQYLPSEVANISVKGSYDLEMYAGQVIYYSDVSEGVIEILNNIGRYVLRHQGACLNASDCEGNLPIKDCSNNLIITAEGNVTEVYNDENCVYLVGDSVKAADAFLYKVLKV